MCKLFLLSLFLGMITSAAFAADTTVTQSHTTFDNDEVTVKTGDNVIFKNSDDVTHNIQITDSAGGNQDLGLQKPSSDIKAPFAKAGEYKVHCAIHPKMKMKVTAQ